MSGQSAVFYYSSADMSSSYISDWRFEGGLVRIDVRIAADSTMLRMVNLLMALSLGVHREQLEQRTGLT